MGTFHSTRNNKSFETGTKFIGTENLKVPENPKMANLSDPFKQKFKDDNQMEAKFPVSFPKFGYTSGGCPLFPKLCNSQ